MNAILDVRNLSKKYGDFVAVKGISFTIDQGEIFSLLVPNGAGKTTTISLLSTLYTPSGGDALVGGRAITKEAMVLKQRRPRS
jgi:ABC-2 type transport system ATP-binding protein